MRSFYDETPSIGTTSSDAQRLRERAATILWIKSQMARHGIAVDDLIAANCFTHETDSKRSHPNGAVAYKDAAGHLWDGKGDMPEWLQRAVNAGQSAEHFRIASDHHADAPAPRAG